MRFQIPFIIFKVKELLSLNVFLPVLLCKNKTFTDSAEFNSKLLDQIFTNNPLFKILPAALHILFTTQNHRSIYNQIYEWLLPYILHSRLFFQFCIRIFLVKTIHVINILLIGDIPLRHLFHNFCENCKYHRNLWWCDIDLINIFFST